MKRIIPFLTLLVMFSVACNQPGENKGKNNMNATTTSEDSAVEKQDGPIEKQQKDVNQIRRVKPDKSDKVVARVDGVPIYADEIARMGLESAITNEILYQEGLRRGFDKKFEDKILDYQMSIIVSNMKSIILNDLPTDKEISNEQIEEYYEANKDKYMNVKLEEINFSDKEKTDEIEKMAREGKELKEIEGKYPDSDVKFRDIGYNRALIKYFDNREVGAVTNVIEKNDGTFSVLKIVEIKEIPLDRAKSAIKHGLEARNKANVLNNYAQKIVEENDVEIEIIEQQN